MLNAYNSDCVVNIVLPSMLGGDLFYKNFTDLYSSYYKLTDKVKYSDWGDIAATDEAL